MSNNPPPFGRVDHVALLTTNPQRAEEFYCRVLGFHVVPRPAFSFDGRWLVRDGVSVMLHLIHRQDFQPFTRDADTLSSHVAFSCIEIDAAIEHLKMNNVPYVEKKLPDYGYRQLFFRDPDGNLLELGEWPERAHAASAR